MALPKIARTILQYIFFFGLAIFLLWFAGKDLKFDELIANIKQANTRPLLSILVVGFLSHIFRALRWKLLIDSMGYKVKSINTFFAVMIGYIINLATPRMGEVARCGILAKYDGVPADKVAGTMVIERIFDLVCLIILIVSTYFLQYNIVNEYFATLLIKLKNAIPSSTLFIILSIVGLLLFAGIFYYKKMKHTESKIITILKNIIEGILSIRKLQQKGLFIFYTIALWASYLLMMYFGFGSLDALKHLDIGAALSLLSFGSIGIIATPGGTGAYQLIIKEILSKLYNIDPTSSLTFGYLSWGVQNIIILLGGVIALICLPIINKKNEPK